MHRFAWNLFIAALVTATTSISHPCSADVSLPHIFSSHMVLQRDRPIHMWGKAEPGEAVTVSIGDHKAAATADNHHKWSVELPALPAGGPLTVTVAGKNTIELSDVLVGEIWVCSGQSNMQFSVISTIDANTAIAAAKHPHIRLFTVPMRPAGKPEGDVAATWVKCNPKTVPSFSAVAYFFGQKLHQDLGVPVGLIHTSWGGTRIEPWTPPAGFAAVSSLAPFLEQIGKADATYQQATAAAIDQYAQWLPKAQKAREANKHIPAPPAWPQHPLDSNGAPTGLYNGMIHPLIPFAIRGAIWYQGESNLADGKKYHDKMKALIEGWRSVWKQGDFPFYFVQLASFHYGNSDPTLLPKLWEAQSETLSVPNTGMAVITDVSEIHDIHPRDKQDVGNRLALIAEAKTYGRGDVVYSGPSFKSMSVDGSRIRLSFDHVGGGLVSRDGKPLDGFTIAGDDKKFVDAVATIEGDSVIVSSPKVEKPAAARFAWNQDAQPNLANKEKLPASSFRTDTW